MKNLAAHILMLVCLACSVIAHAGRQIYLTPEKLVYPYPLDGTMTIMGYLREVPAGTPVNISVSLALPDGNVTWLNPDMEFHVTEANILDEFPFVAVPLAKLFETDGSKIFRPVEEAYGDLPAGRYVMRTVMSGPGVSDSSEAVFFLVSEELLPSIAETPRPIIDSLDPEWGDSGSVITVTGRNLRGLPGLVEPDLIDRLQIKVTLAGEELQLTDMDPEGTWLRVRLSAAPRTGDMVVNVTLPYWDMLEQPDHLGIPRVAVFSSNAFPFWAAPVITGIDGEVAPGGSITIKGRNFSDDKLANQVLFNEVPGTVTEADSESLKVTVPAVSGSSLIRVYPVSNGIPGRVFTVRSASPAISRIAPGTLVPGDTLRISGRGFGEDAESVAVYLGGVPLEVLSVSDTSISARTPENLVHGVYELTLVVNGFETVAPARVIVVPVWQ